MRRNEFNIQDKQSITNLLSECEYGTLSLISQGKPYGVAVNFVWHNEKIFIHGALQGRKVDAINENHLASFLVVQAFSTIPSYFSNTMAVCPALILQLTCVGLSSKMAVLSIILVYMAFSYAMGSYCPSL
ncbi:MAG: hypothetical protein CVU67_03755 [Deltaproteobacteria bacterium HGW-Deltaproteobacteria-24]|nr:MAG: hypothetical protein CVU67_03755 [Deltaproteobacteria bacterium HGW-Deltaproteobacteria-24]